MAPKLNIQSIFSAVDQVTGPVKKMQGSVVGYGKAASASFSGAAKAAGLVRSALVGAVAAVTTGAIAKAVTTFADKADSIGKTARVLGVSTKALQELSYAAQMQGVEMSNLESGFKIFNKNMGELKTKQGALYSGLSRTNPALARQLRAAKDSDEAFMLLMQAIDGETNAQKRAALAQAAFGRSGQDLIKLTDGGIENFIALRKEADRYGLVIGDDAIEAGDKFGDSLDRLKKSGTALANDALAGIIVKMQPLLQKAADWIAANKDLISQDIKSVIDDISGAVGFLKWGFDSGLIPAVLAGVLSFKSINTAIGITQFFMTALPALMASGSTVMFAFSAVLGGAATAGEAFNMVMAANPLGLIVTVVALLVAGFTLLASRVGGIGPAFKVIGQTVLKFLLMPFNLLIEGVSAFFGLLAKIPGVGKIFSGISTAIKSQQAIMNSATGSGQWYDLTSPYRDARAAATTPVSPNAGIIESRSISESRSTLDINIPSLPSGASVRQSGRAPGVTVNTGYAFSGGAH